MERVCPSPRTTEVGGADCSFFPAPPRSSPELSSGGAGPGRNVRASALMGSWNPSEPESARSFLQHKLGVSFCTWRSQGSNTFSATLLSPLLLELAGFILTGRGGAPSMTLTRGSVYFLIDGDTFLPAPQEAASNTYHLPKTTLTNLGCFQ